MTANKTLTSLNLSCEEKGKGKRKNNKQKDGYMTDNEIGDEGAKAMSEMLKLNTTLTSLNLWSEEEGK